jgi:hypothetical protein
MSRRRPPGDSDSVAHSSRHGHPIGGRFTDRHAANNLRTLHREQPIRSAMACWLSPRRRSRWARSAWLSVAMPSRIAGSSSRARAHARRQVMVMSRMQWCAGWSAQARQRRTYDTPTKSVRNDLVGLPHGFRHLPGGHPVRPLLQPEPVARNLRATPGRCV